MFRSLPFKIILCAFTMLLLGGVGGFLTSSSLKDWFESIEHPAGRPPNWVFGPVWSALYLMIGISFALIWHYHPQQIGKTCPTLFFLSQLILNLLWTPVFFGLHQLEAALIIIFLMWLFIALTVHEFAKLSKAAATLLIPYLLWVTFAIYLNAAYAWLN
ncbi:MAG: TspO/MBR family protein [Akkermansiaceae bacterium]